MSETAIVQPNASASDAQIHRGQHEGRVVTQLQRRLGVELGARDW